jgi:hypothetical protein
VDELTSKFLSVFWEKFSTRTFYKKYVRGVFELPSPSNAQKCTKINSRNKKQRSRLVGGWVWGLSNARMALASDPIVQMERGLGGALRQNPAIGYGTGL